MYKQELHYHQYSEHQVQNSIYLCYCQLDIISFQHTSTKISLYCVYTHVVHLVTQMVYSIHPYRSRICDSKWVCISRPKMGSYCLNYCLWFSVYLILVVSLYLSRRYQFNSKWETIKLSFRALCIDPQFIDTIHFHPHKINSHGLLRI